MPLAATARAIAEVGAAHCVLASDGGQASRAAAPQMLLSFAEDLAGAGIDRHALRQMMCDNPADLPGV